MINKLAEKAGIGQVIHVGGGEWEWSSPEAQVFAQLIIDECVAICTQRAEEIAVSRRATTDFELKNILAYGETTAEKIRAEIKKRFGVEDGSKN